MVRDQQRCWARTILTYRETGDPSVRRGGGAVEALGVDPEENGHAVAGACGDHLWFNARTEPCGDRGMAKVLGSLGQL